MTDTVITVSLKGDEAWAMAEFVKRVGRDDCNRLAADQAEADAMYEGFIQLREALRERGFAPR